VLTAITVQDTVRVHDVFPLPPSLIAAQLACVLADPGADAIKTGMLVNAAIIHAIAAVLAQQPCALPLIVDPVILSTSGHPLLDPDGVAALATMYPSVVQAVLLKGGHLPTDPVTDLLVTHAGEALFTHPRHVTRHTHGTGCTLAAAIATGLAQGLALQPGVARAIAYVQRAIATAPGLGAGQGPLNHCPAAT
jgi:hydroxymethylpyrimidine/phosphomethylpyrimidine kinase